MNSREKTISCTVLDKIFEHVFSCNTALLSFFLCLSVLPNDPFGSESLKKAYLKLANSIKSHELPCSSISLH